MVEDLYQFKEELFQRGIFFCFNGPISQMLLVEIGEALEQKMKLEKASTSTVFKVFSMIMETAQNIIRYSAETFPSPDDEVTSRFGTIAVGYEEGAYFVLCGNMVYKKDVDELQRKLLKLQRMSREELKKYYKSQRKRGPDNKSKGAGLGFIDMAKKASKPLEFHFRDIDDHKSYFSLKTVI